MTGGSEDAGGGGGSGGDDGTSPYSPIVAWFAEGNEVLVSDEQSEGDYRAELEKVPGLFDLVAAHSNGCDANSETASETGADAFGAELLLEGLHQYLKLGREDLDSRITYKEMVKFQLLKPRPARA